MAVKFSVSSTVDLFKFLLGVEEGYRELEIAALSIL